jgi:hypothetical protein
MVGWQAAFAKAPTRGVACLTVKMRGPLVEIQPAALRHCGGVTWGWGYGMRITVRIANVELFTRTYWPSTKRHS